MDNPQNNQCINILKSGLVLFLMFSFSALLTASVSAQGFEISGVVLDGETEEPVPGANVVELGTQTGTVTNDQGEFELTVSASDVQIRVSFIGYDPQTIDVDGQEELRILLGQSVGELDDLVVTAFGVERDQRSLGYSVSRIDGDAIAETRSTNIADNLSGQVAGLQVTSPSTGPAGSSRMVIRGVTSLTGNNEPLIVVDGVPIDDRNIGQAGEWGGFDGGEGLSSLNQDDIEEMTVLKGPSATALYGSRAQNGAVLVTTKSGSGMDGYRVDIRSNVTFENILVPYDEFQDDYGQGTRGEIPQTQGEALSTGLSSWGARITGDQEGVQFDGETRPYEAHPDNMQNFYDTGVNMSNNIAVSGGSENSSFRLSVTRLNSDGIIPATSLDRDNINFIGQRSFGDLTVEAKANYVIEETNFRPQLSDNPSNPALSLTFMPTTLDVLELENHKDEQGEHIPFTNTSFRPNPYWGYRENGNSDDRRRLIGFVRANYDLTDWLSLQARGGTDFYTLRRTTWDSQNTPWVEGGQMNENEYRVREDNIDLLLQGERSLTEDLGMSATLGAARVTENFENLSQFGQRFVVPDLITIGNTSQDTRNLGYSFSEKKVNSLFGSADFSYKDLLFLELTARNDWSSTLPDDNNSYFYPSVNVGFSFAEAFDLTNEFFSYGQFRASWAQVGGDTDPYQLNLNYSISGSHPTKGGDNVSHGQVQNSTIPLADLKPTSTDAVEAGVDLRFYEGRIGLDLTVYQQNTTDQILGTTVSQTSGYGERLINAGEIQNKGLEILLTGRPVETENFQWNSSLNYSRNKNEVVSLEEGLESLRLGQSRSLITFVDARVGEPYGQIVGAAYQRNDEGQIVYDDDGLPLTENNEVLGNFTPDWTAGFNNTFSYKNFSLSSLIDIRWGGEIYSLTNAQAYAAGNHESTLDGREGLSFNDDGDLTGGGVIGEGVNEDGQTNDVAVDPEVYYGYLSTDISEEFVYDASYIKLRSLSFGYTLPSELVQRVGLTNAKVSVVGRNLWLIHKNTPNIDPESAINTSNAQGLEHATLPSTRNIGFDISLQF
ncbi:MAG: SusC/RagA family TonB-linked outer membrane protein [Balneolaceae bacterium]